MVSKSSSGLAYFHIYTRAYLFQVTGGETVNSKGKLNRYKYLDKKKKGK